MTLKKHNPGCNCCCTPCGPDLDECCDDCLSEELQLDVPSGEFINDFCLQCDESNEATYVLVNASPGVDQICRWVWTDPGVPCITGLAVYLEHQEGQGCRFVAEVHFRGNPFGPNVTHFYKSAWFELPETCAGQTYTLNYHSSEEDPGLPPAGPVPCDSAMTSLILRT